MLPLYLLPGICKVNSSYASEGQAGFAQGRAARGRWVDGNGHRFVAGFPEKIGGRSSSGLISSGITTLTGTPRGMRDWRDNSQVIRTAIGTHSKLFYYSPASFTDITPYRAITSGTLGANPIATTNGSSTVTVTHTAHGLSTGDYIQLSGATAINGVTANGVWNPITKVDANSYTFVYTGNASASSSGGGAAVLYTYYRVTLGASPFATTSGSANVVVTHTSHGAIEGDYVSFSGATAVAGLTISGEYQIVAPAANSYTIVASSNANATTTGGGSAVTAQYDLSIGNIDTISGSGFGTGSYGSGGYGQSSGVSVTFPARTWSLWQYGQQMLCSPVGGTIYVWDPNIGGRAAPLFNAPATIQAMFVTPERFIIALGTGSNYLQMQWPDQTVNTNWTAASNNTANNGRTVQGGAYFVGGIHVLADVNLLFTNTACFVHQYTGDALVFQTRQVGDNCGLAGPLAVTVLGGVAYWMSNSDFWMWNGGAPTPIPSDDIHDYVFGTSSQGQGINLGQVQKFVARTVAAKKEIHFHYASANSQEIDRYVIFHTDQNCWSIGTRNLTCATDKGLYLNPMSCDSSGHFYNDETGTDADGSALDSYVVSSLADISNGDRNMDIFGFVIDSERQTGNLSLSVNTRTYPNDMDTVDGPYTITAAGQRQDLRSAGKLAGFKLESNVVGGDWRLGLPRFDVQPSGTRG